MSTIAMESVCYPQFSAQANTVHVVLFQDVQNAAQLRARLVAAASIPGAEGDAEREAVNYAFIDARLICSPLHLRTAAYHSLMAYEQKALRTKSVHSEIIWMLNPSNNISEALRRYGLNDDTRSLFVVRVTNPRDRFYDKILGLVKGRPVPLDHLKDITDWAAVKKYHKLNNEPAVRNAKGNTEVEHARINSIVISTVATKLVLS